MLDTPKLSIVIPSYNRNATVLVNLPILLAQLNPEVELQILDNCSKEPLAETLASLIAGPGGDGVKIIRHAANIGAAANILRSFEVASAPWLWILGDDDVLTPDAVSLALKAIEDHPEANFINFRTSTMAKQGLRPKPFTTVGQADFVRNHDYPGNVNFMSVSLWRLQTILPSIHLAYHYAYSMSSTFVLLLTSLRETGQCHFSSDIVVDTVTTAEASTKWHFSDFILGWNTILELPMVDDTRRAMARKMYSWHSPENVTVYLLAEALKNSNGVDRYYLAVNRFAPYIGRFASLRFQLYKLLFWSPKLGWLIVVNVVRLANHLKLKNIDLNDIIERVKS
jgi:glycosyltransferase involved in cell wall biosynthesis